MESATTAPAVPVFEVDFDLLVAARRELDRVKHHFDRGWECDEQMEAFHFGRCVEACDRAFDGMSNALIVITIFGKIEKGRAALDHMNDEPEAQS